MNKLIKKNSFLIIIFLCCMLIPLFSGPSFAYGTRYMDNNFAFSDPDSETFTH